MRHGGILPDMRSRERDPHKPDRHSRRAGMPYLSDGWQCPRSAGEGNADIDQWRRVHAVFRDRHKRRKEEKSSRAHLLPRPPQYRRRPRRLLRASRNAVEGAGEVCNEHPRPLKAPPRRDRRTEGAPCGRRQRIGSRGRIRKQQGVYRSHCQPVWRRGAPEEMCGPNRPGVHARYLQERLRPLEESHREPPEKRR